MKLFNKLKGLFKRKEQPRKKAIIKEKAKQSKIKKTKIKNTTNSKKMERLIRKSKRAKFVSNFKAGLKLQKKNKRRKKKKMEKASKKRNRK